MRDALLWRKSMRSLDHGKRWKLSTALSTTPRSYGAFAVEGFLAPYVVVRRKSDGVRGTLTFQHSPRFYFDFAADK